MKNSILLMLILLLFGCCKEDDKKGVKTNNKGEIISLPYLWKIPIHEDGNWLNHNSSLDNNMVFGKHVIIPRTINSESRMLTMIDSKDGSILWNWSEWYQPKTEGAHLNWIASNGDLLHWTTGTRRYSINTMTGETILRHRNFEDRSFSRLVNEFDITYMINSHENTEGYQVSSVFKGSMIEEEYIDFLNVPYSTDTLGELNRVKGITYAEPYKKNDIDYLIIKSSQSFPNWYYDMRMNLYNLTDKKWVYLDKIAAEPKQNNSGWMKIYNDNFYFTAGREMFCYNILTGEQLWKREFPHDFTFSGFEIADDIMVANCENSRAYGINIDNGITIWESEGSGTSSHLNNRIMNGVVYFDGGSPAFLFAKDIHTGKTIWKLDPYEFEESNAYWSNNVNVIPGENGEKGKVVVVSGTHAYCFEAVK